MGITKREIASELGVSKRTVANYIEKLGLGNHVSRNGNTDFLDDFAAAAIADALKNPGKPSRQPADAPAAPAPDSLVDSLAAQLEIERSRNAELMEALAAERDRAARAGGHNRTQEQLRLDREAGARHVGALHRAQAGPGTDVSCTVLKQGRAYVAIVPVDPGYRTMGKYACNQYTRVLRRLFTFCRNAHDHRITFVLRRRNEDYVAIAPLDPPDTED